MHWEQFIISIFYGVKGEKYEYYYIWYLAETLLQRSDIMRILASDRIPGIVFYLIKIYNLTENARWEHPIHSV